MIILKCSDGSCQTLQKLTNAYRQTGLTEPCWIEDFMVKCPKTCNYCENYFQCTEAIDENDCPLLNTERITDKDCLDNTVRQKCLQTCCIHAQFL